MTVTLYNRGLGEMDAWTTGTYKFLLLKGSGYVLNRDHDYVSDLTVASNECSVAGYVRATASTKTKTIDDATDNIVYDCDDPSFGSPAVGETITACVLYREVTTDADSPLIAYFTLGSVDTTGGAFNVMVSANGIMDKAQV